MIYYKFKINIKPKGLKHANLKNKHLKLTYIYINMDIVYKGYCISRMLFDKGSSYVLGNELKDFKKTERVYGDNKGVIGSVYDLTYEASPINDFILLGNACNARDYYKLKEENVGLIVNCTKDIPDYFEDEFEYERVDVKDINEANILPHLDRLSDIIENFKNKNPGKKVLVHCFMGSSRSATIVIAYLMKYKGLRRRDALNFCKDKRALVNINTDFFAQLLEYEKTLNY